MIAVGEERSIQELKREKLYFINGNTLRTLFVSQKLVSYLASTCIQFTVVIQQSKSATVTLNLNEMSARLSDSIKNLVSRQREFWI
jgi:hypothetical protein